MSSIRRPGGSLDTRSLGRAVSFPGIDPRVWVSLGIVTAVNVDPVSGPFVDLTLLPSGLNACARVGAASAGDGFGDWCPLRVDDEVMVAAPDGEPAHGLVVLARMWCQADPPPALAVSAPEDRLIQAKPGTNLLLVVTEEGALLLSAGRASVNLSSAHGRAELVGDDVRLGDASATHPVPFGDNLINALATFAATCATSATDPTLVTAANALLLALASPTAPVLSLKVKTA